MLYKGVLALILFAAAGCQSYTEQTREIRESFTDGQFDSALSQLESSDLRETERHRLVYLLEKGMILDRMNQSVSSRQTLMEADRQVDLLYRSSLVGDVASFIYNDSASDYQGEDYEKVGIHTMLALSFLGDNKLKKARVEARAINVRLNEINNFYKENKNTYKEDAFARFLSGLIFESLGDYNSALVDYRRALALYEGDYSKYFGTGVPNALVRSMWWVASKRNNNALLRTLKKKFPKVVSNIKYKGGYSSLVMISEVGHIARKVSKSFVMVWDGKPMRFSFPALKVPGSYSWGKNGFWLGSRFVAANQVQDMNYIARRTLEDSRSRYMLKMASRIVLKDQLNQQAKRNFGLIGGLAASIFGAVTETADTRAWTLLPAKFYITRMDVKPGTYTVRKSNKGHIEPAQKITLKKNQTVFLRSF